LLTFFFLPVLAFATDNDGSILKIVSPKNEAIVAEEVEVKYELQKGTQGDHVHAYVDGKYQKDFKGTLMALTKGRHEITLKVANSDHDVLATSDTIVVEVK
jgi:hypothetical protein